MPKVSIVVPFHWMKDWQFFMERCLKSIEEQSFTDYEIVMMKVGKMAETTNAVIKKATGDLIKILYLDDYFAHKHALQDIVDAFTDSTQWLITGCDTNEFPYYTKDIRSGNNKLGSPSCLTIRNKNPLLFDERLSWLLDCELYQRLYEKYGLPTVLNGVNVNIGIHPGQMTNILTDEEKLSEHKLLQ